ncbi:MAG TPA: hypothetical protein VF898_10765 [Chloroflexota bacterium]
MTKRVHARCGEIATDIGEAISQGVVFTLLAIDEVLIAGGDTATAILTSA